jgi:hypothetical protein
MEWFFLMTKHVNVQDIHYSFVLQATQFEHDRDRCGELGFLTQSSLVDFLLGVIITPSSGRQLGLFMTT